MTNHDLVPLAVAVPLLAAALLPLLSHFRFKVWVLDLLSIAMALVSVAMDTLLVVGSGNPYVYWFGGWSPVGSFPIGIPFLVEPVAAGAALLAAVLTTAGLVFSSKHFDAYGTFFQSLLLVFLAAMTGFCLAADLFNQFVFFELMGVAAYALTGYKIEDTGPLEGGLNFAVMNSMGAISILMGVGLVYGTTGSLTMVDVGTRLAARGPDVLVMAAMAMFLCGYFVKAAILPFHFWLPDAHAVAPTAASVLFSGIMVETSVIGGFRTMRWVFAPVLGADEHSVGGLILILGAGTAILGAVMALLQRHIKRLLAFSTISHVGIMVGSLGLLTKQALAGCFVYILGHGLIKGALFCCTGIILHRKGSVDELDLYGRCKNLRICGILFFLAAAGLVGLPPFATFSGKSLIDDGARAAGCHWFPWIAASATAVTAAAVIRAGARIFLGLGMSDAVTESAPLTGSVEGRETKEGQGKTPMTMWVPTALLILLAVAAGSFPKVAQLADAAVSLYLQPAVVREMVLHGMPYRLPNGVPLRYEGELLAVAFVTGAVALIIGAAFLAPKSKTKKVVTDTTVAMAKPLRALHSGYVGDYAAWFVVGTGFLLLVLVCLVW